MTLPAISRLLFAGLFGVGLAACGSGLNDTHGAALPPTSKKVAASQAIAAATAQPLSITYAHNVVENEASGVSNTITTTQPTAGNLLIANVIDYTYQGGGAIVDPAGWTLVDSATTSSTLTSKTYYHWVKAGDSGTWTFGFNKSCYSSALIMELANVDPLAPITAHQIRSVLGTTSFTTASLSSTRSNSFAVALFSENGTTSIASEASGWTDDFHRSGAMQNVLLHATANGAVQSSLTWTNAESGFATLIILAPANGVPTSPSPSPTATPQPLPSITPGPSGSTLGRVGLLQVFDFHMTSAQRATDGPRYDLVWGANYPSAWHTNHPSLIASYYYIIEQSDATHNLAWYQAYHPDWILYNCTSTGTPTRTPAYMQAGAYGTNVPLDIQNPAVVSFQIRTLAAPPAISGGFNALAMDQVVFANIMGGNAGTGSYGCGIYQGSTFVRRYASKSDSRFTADVVNWVKIAKSILTTDAVIAPHHLKLIVNHPAGSISSSYEQQLIANVDAGLNEVGFSNYGNYTKSSSQFATSLSYMIYLQAHGVMALLIDKFVQSGALTSIQREWAVGTYLMGNNGNALMYATYGGYGTGGYGQEYYYSEYSKNIGTPCGAVTGGPVIYERKFQNGLVVVNASTSAASASLPLGHTYSDIEGRTVTNPLPVPGTNAFVMTTLAGTGCL